MMYAVTRMWCIVLLAVALTGCTGLQPQPTEPMTPLEQAREWYLATGVALEQARELVKDWHGQGLLTDEDVAVAALIWAEAQGAMTVWKEVLNAAAANNGVLPAHHPVVMLRAQEMLARLKVLLTAAASARRQRPTTTTASHRFHRLRR